MSNVPLLCNICPRNPEFSDVSHLLTHVASKGHLSQYNKAKLRAHQDVSFLEKLEVYDHWYQRHQIERLLSERMIAKDSKDYGRRPRTTKVSSRSAGSTKGTRRRKSQIKVVEHPEPERSPVKIEGLVDPQLSLLDRVSARPGDRLSPFVGHLLSEDGCTQTQLSPNLMTRTHHIDPLAFQSQSQHPYDHKAPIPYMSRWQGASSPLRAIPEGSGADTNFNPPNDDTDGESDYFQTFLRSPTRTAYPDPSEVPCLRSAISINSSSPTRKERDSNHDGHDMDFKDEMSGITQPISQSPILRGIKWPGMSIFDSASLEAQRLRNQRKTDTVIEQMEQNSAMVEQLERIYWPDGSLKAQRLITGEVESSPPRELTPPPKLTKRRRSKVVKSVLTDLSTNVSRSNRRPRNRKVPGRIPSMRVSDLQGISQQALTSLDAPKPIHARSAHTGRNPLDDADDEWLLTAGLTSSARRRPFEVFNDEGSNEPTRSALMPHTYQKSSTSMARDRHSALRSESFAPSSQRRPNNSMNSRASPRLAMPLPPRESFNRSRSSFVNENNENIEPFEDEGGFEHDQASFASRERVTQRYFSITGNQQPQFFSSMPPGMDFGGFNEFNYHGSTLNPLNPYLRQQRSTYSPANAPSFPKHGLPFEISCGGEQLQQPDLGGQNGSVGARRLRQ